MNRLLLLLVPDKSATFSAGVLSASAFLLGLLDMLTLDLDSARFLPEPVDRHHGYPVSNQIHQLEGRYSVAEQARAAFTRNSEDAQSAPPSADLTEATGGSSRKGQDGGLVIEISGVEQHPG